MTTVAVWTHANDGTRVIPSVRELPAGEGGAGAPALQCVLRRPDDAR